VLQVSNHLLPWPQAASIKSMRRQALDVTIAAPFGPVRITNTHLEFHSRDQRDAQIMHLLDLQEEASTNPVTAKRDNEPYASQTIAASGILCGDFNFDVSDPQHALLHRSARPGLNYRDAWSLHRQGQPRTPTSGVHDHAQWPNGPDCRDFVFVTEDLAPRIRRVEVDVDTASSDHQPVLLELAG
jgi:endonuclease/exonuclease/phosphatase family metal-dependent hydrolase